MIRPLIVLRPEDAGAVAALHARCFPDPWSQASFVRSLQTPGALAFGTMGTTGLAGFVLVQVVAGEADVMTIATAPESRREGIASALLTGIIGALGETGVSRLTLEVAEDNTPARALYRQLGFSEDGRRAKYYTSGRNMPVDAILMSLRVEV